MADKPEKKFSTGAICATIWKNTGKGKSGQDVEYHTVALDRRYKDKNNEWKSTNSLRVTDIPKATLVLNKAYEYLVLRDNHTSTTPTDEDTFEEIVM